MAEQTDSEESGLDVATDVVAVLDELVIAVAESIDELRRSVDAASEGTRSTVSSTAIEIVDAVALGLENLGADVKADTGRLDPAPMLDRIEQTLAEVRAEMVSLTEAAAESASADGNPLDHLVARIDDLVVAVAEELPDRARLEAVADLLRRVAAVVARIDRSVAEVHATSQVGELAHIAARFDEIALTVNELRSRVPDGAGISILVQQAADEAQARWTRNIEATVTDAVESLGDELRLLVRTTLAEADARAERRTSELNEQMGQIALSIAELDERLRSSDADRPAAQ